MATADERANSHCRLSETQPVCPYLSRRVAHSDLLQREVMSELEDGKMKSYESTRKKGRARQGFSEQCTCAKCALLADRRICLDSDSASLAYHSHYRSALAEWHLGRHCVRAATAMSARAICRVINNEGNLQTCSLTNSRSERRGSHYRGPINQGINAPGLHV